MEGNRERWVVTRRRHRETVFARDSNRVRQRGPATSSLGGSVASIVHFTFGTDVPANTVATWLSTIGACGIVRAVPGSDRSYVVTVRRSGAMEYLETLLSEGERREVLARRDAAP